MKLSNDNAAEGGVKLPQSASMKRKKRKQTNDENVDPSILKPKRMKTAQVKKGGGKDRRKNLPDPVSRNVF